MVNENSTKIIGVPSNEPLLPNIIFDFVNIGFCFIAIFKTCLIILWILIRRLLTRSEENVLFLLSLNMYMSILVFNCLCLDMFISMVRGHMHTSIWPINNNLLWCRLKAYLSNVTLICSLYSTTFQALHRCLRITYYTNAMLYRNIYLYSAGIIVQIFASMLQPLPLFLLNIYQYDDYHCQVQFTNWSGMIIAACLVWLLPVLLTVAIYVYTIHYIRRNSQQFTFRQRTRIKRDITIIRRIFWLIIFILIFGMPACSTTIVYYIFGYVEWWENHMIWLTFILSFMGISTVQTFYSPHLRTLWLKSSRRISLAICT